MATFADGLTFVEIGPVRCGEGLSGASEGLSGASEGLSGASEGLSDASEGLSDASENVSFDTICPISRAIATNSTGKDRSFATKGPFAVSRELFVLRKEFSAAGKGLLDGGKDFLDDEKELFFAV